MTRRLENEASQGLKGKVIDPEAYVGRDPARNEAKVRRGFARKAKRCLRLIPLASDAVSAYFCMLDGKTPLWVKGTVAAALAYFILPIDAMPDLLPIVGLGDDASVIAAALTAVTAHINADHRRQAHEWLETEHIILDVEPNPTPSPTPTHA